MASRRELEVLRRTRCTFWLHSNSTRKEKSQTHN